jgi:hypothetical protein
MRAVADLDLTDQLRGGDRWETGGRPVHDMYNIVLEVFNGGKSWKDDLRATNFIIFSGMPVGAEEPY